MWLWIMKGISCILMMLFWMCFISGLRFIFGCIVFWVRNIIGFRFLRKIFCIFMFIISSRRVIGWVWISLVILFIRSFGFSIWVLSWWIVSVRKLILCMKMLRWSLRWIGVWRVWLWMLKIKVYVVMDFFFVIFYGLIVGLYCWF